MTESAYLVDPGFVRVVDVGSGVRALFYEDGAVRIEHACRIVEDTQLIVAPALRR